MFLKNTNLRHLPAGKKTLTRPEKIARVIIFWSFVLTRTVKKGHDFR
jgi:hypothetical protein